MNWPFPRAGLAYQESEPPTLHELTPDAATLALLDVGVTAPGGAVQDVVRRLRRVGLVLARVVPVLALVWTTATPSPVPTPTAERAVEVVGR